MGTAGKGVARASGKLGARAGGKGAAKDADGECPECCETFDCTLCGFGSSATATVAGITICPCDSFNQGIVGDPNGTYTVPNSGESAPCDYNKLLSVFFEKWADPGCTGDTNPALEEQFTMNFNVSTIAGVTTINASILSVHYQIFSATGVFTADDCAAHGPFVLTNTLVGPCVDGGPWGINGTITITP